MRTADSNDTGHTTSPDWETYHKRPIASVEKMHQAFGITRGGTITEAQAAAWQRGFEQARDLMLADLDALEAERDRLRGFLDWLVRLDEPGNDQRRTITLTRIIFDAKACLSALSNPTATTEKP